MNAELMAKLLEMVEEIKATEDDGCRNVALEIDLDGESWVDIVKSDGNSEVLQF